MEMNVPPTFSGKAVRRAVGLSLLLGSTLLVLAAPALGRPAVTKVTVTAGKPTEFGFALSPKSIPAGKVTFTVKNAGTVAHDFKLCSSPSGGTADTCAGKVTKLIDPGASAALTLTLAKGRYEYLCTVPTHAAAGMKGVLTVK
jgi:uncharacterized cupredoxin-like copper-binding protein